MEKAALGKRLRQIRIQKGFTQQALAQKADIGVVYLGEIERGLKMPSLSVFIKIVEALGVSADYVLWEELSSGSTYICNEITKKMESLSPKQRKTIADILDVYINSL